MMYVLAAYMIFTLMYFLLIARNAGASSPLFLVLLTTLPYALAPAIDIVFFNNSNQFNVYNVTVLSCFCASFYLSFIPLVLAKRKRAYLRDTRGLLVTPAVGPSVFLTLFIALYLPYAYMSLQLTAGYSNRAMMYQSKPIYFDILKLAISVYIVTYAVLNANSRQKKFRLILFTFMALFLLIEVFVLQDRRVWLATLLAVWYAYRYAVPGKLKMISFGVTAVGLGILFLAVGVFRGGGRSLDDFTRVLNISNMEFGAFGKIFDYCWSHSCEFNNLSYLNLPRQMIPSMFVSERPLPPSALYAKNFNQEYYEKGGTYAYNFVLEAIQNLGFAGPFILGFLFSIVFFMHSRIKSNLAVLVGALLVYILAFFFRMELLSIAKIGLIALTFLMFFSLLQGRLKMSRRSAPREFAKC